MPLTLTSGLIIFLGLVITWCILYSIFSEKSSLKLGLKLGALVLLFSPFISKFSYDTYAALSRLLFLMNSNGEIQLAISPLKIPHGKNIDNYCNQFKNSNGHPLDIFSIGTDGNAYCGSFLGLYEQKTVYLPYKIINDKQAMYWASPELSIVGPKPDFPSVKKSKALLDNRSSEKPKEIHIKEGQSANVVIIKSFDITLENQEKKTITAGTVLPGTTLDPLHANENPSPIQIKLMIDKSTCIVSSINPIRPDYKTATAVVQLTHLNCSRDESNTLAIEAIASVPGRIIYAKKPLNKG